MPKVIAAKTESAGGIGCVEAELDEPQHNRIALEAALKQFGTRRNAYIMFSNNVIQPFTQVMNGDALKVADKQFFVLRQALSGAIQRRQAHTQKNSVEVGSFSQNAALRSGLFGAASALTGIAHSWLQFRRICSEIKGTAKEPVHRNRKIGSAGSLRYRTGVFERTRERWPCEWNSETTA